MDQPRRGKKAIAMHACMAELEAVLGPMYRALQVSQAASWEGFRNHTLQYLMRSHPLVSLRSLRRLKSSYGEQIFRASFFLWGFHKGLAMSRKVLEEREAQRWREAMEAQADG